MTARIVVFALLLLLGIEGLALAEQPYRLIRADGKIASDDTTEAEFAACAEASKDASVDMLPKGKAQEEQMYRDMLSPQGWRLPMKQLAAIAATMARTMDCLTARGYPIMVGR